MKLFKLPLIVLPLVCGADVEYQCGPTVFTLMPKPGCIRIDTGEVFQEGDINPNFPPQIEFDLSGDDDGQAKIKATTENTTLVEFFRLPVNARNMTLKNLLEVHFAGIEIPEKPSNEQLSDLLVKTLLCAQKRRGQFGDRPAEPVLRYCMSTVTAK